VTVIRPIKLDEIEEHLIRLGATHSIELYCVYDTDQGGVEALRQPMIQKLEYPLSRRLGNRKRRGLVWAVGETPATIHTYQVCSFVAR